MRCISIIATKLMFLSLVTHSTSPDPNRFHNSAHNNYSIHHAKQNTVDVKNFGAKGDGVTDDTKAIQDAVNAGAKIYIPKGKYMINAIKSINVSSNKTITWAPGASFIAIPNSAASYHIIYLINCTNVTLINPNIIGDRDSHTGTAGEWGHGLVIGVGSNINIINARISNCWGDGLAIYGGNNILIKNLVSDNNRRMGLTITKGKNINVMNPVCSNSHGTSPEAGIDIEPNTNTDNIININLVNPVTRNNKGSGISVSLAHLINNAQNVGVTITNHTDSGSAYGLYVGPLGEGNQVINGTISDLHPIYTNNTYCGIRIDSYAANNTPAVKIMAPQIINPNNSGQASARYGSGIVFLREAAQTQTGDLGNVLIQNADIKDTRPVPKMVYGFHFNDDKGAVFKNVKIVSPVEIKGVPPQNKFFIAISGVSIINAENVSTITSPSDLKLPLVISSVSNDANSRSMVSFSLNQGAIVLDAATTFTVKSSGGIRIVPGDNVSIGPLSNAGAAIKSTEVGAILTLRKLSPTQWQIVNKKGDWEYESKR